MVVKTYLASVLKKRAVIACLFVFCLVFPWKFFLAEAGAFSGEGPGFVDLIYIESNTGGASGGHVGLRLNGFVYHFQQYPDGFFRLKRDGWEHFRQVYNDIENRSMFVAETRVAPGTLKALERRLTLLLLAQARNFDNLEALSGNYRFIKSSVTGKDSSVEIPGLGLYDMDSKNVPPSMQHLHKSIIARFGKGFFNKCFRAIQEQMARLDTCPAPHVTFPLDRMDLVPLVRTFPQAFAELYSIKAAIAVLRHGISIKEEMLMDGGAICPCFKKSLSSLKERLEESIISSLGSGNPGRGQVLLVQIARYQAVSRSIKAGRLLVLDPFPEDCQKVSPDIISADRYSMEMLHEDLKRRLIETENGFCTGKKLDQVAYNGLENQAARLYELQRGLENQAAVRMHDGAGLPCKAARVRVRRSTGLDPAILGKPGQDLAGYRACLRRIYSYNLVTSNCVTELAREAETALGEGAMAESVSRSITGPSDFIPFMFFRKWVSCMKPATVVFMPSLRKRRLAELYRHENPLVVYLREFNTMSSTVYRPNPADTSFLLFTDDVLLPRPLFGAVNTVWGVFCTAAGVLVMPFDHGGQLRHGFWGIVYSLPELLFSNIRKGSFSWTGQ
ncbi:MAG: hypothetical protein DSZ23_02860 [Thermodesulfatator sp.]|nr:MAG: hypothetical protein DSZ23_02860 [Thermodesulfatator sp.]